MLVDLGHHLHGTNIEQIVALLRAEDRLGGFHFNNRKYATWCGYLVPGVA